jgi:DNA-binding CsgD family transcriptional regulator
MTPPAAVFGSACEGVLPAILLFLLKTLKISIIPPVKRRIKSLDFGNLIIFVIPFIWLSQDYQQTFNNLEKYNQLELLGKFLFQLFLAGGLLITYYWVYTTTNRRHVMELEFEKQRSEEAQRRYEEEKKRREEEYRLNQEKIAALNTQNDELKRMNEHLNNLTSKPQVVIDDIAKLIKSNMEISEKLQQYQASLSDYVVVKPNALIGYNLTVNEKVVLEGIIEGKTSQEIADTSYLAEGSVRNISRKLYKKFGVRNKDDLVKLIAEKSSN